MATKSTQTPPRVLLATAFLLFVFQSSTTCAQITLALAHVTLPQFACFVVAVQELFGGFATLEAILQAVPAEVFSPVIFSPFSAKVTIHKVSQRKDQNNYKIAAGCFQYDPSLNRSLSDKIEYATIFE